MFLGSYKILTISCFLKANEIQSISFSTWRGIGCPPLPSQQYPLAISFKVLGLPPPAHAVMLDIIAESTFGRALHVVSRGKLFPTLEQRDPSLLLPYQHKEPASPQLETIRSLTRVPTTSSIFSRRLASTSEKGQDYQLVDFTEHDPESM